MSDYQLANQASHASKVAFRLTVPMVVRVLHIDWRGALALQFCVGVALLFLAGKIALDLFGDRIVAVATIFGVSAIYAGKGSVPAARRHVRCLRLLLSHYGRGVSQSAAHGDHTPGSLLHRRKSNGGGPTGARLLGGPHTKGRWAELVHRPKCGGGDRPGRRDVVRLHADVRLRPAHSHRRRQGRGLRRPAPDIAKLPVRIPPRSWLACGYGPWLPASGWSC